MQPIVLVSNRGPLSWSVDEAGDLHPRRGAGGLVSGLGPLVAGTDALWIASALSDGDREAAAKGLDEGDGLRSRLLAHDPDVLRSAYDVVGNGVLWFIHHGLYDLARRPRFDRTFAAAWEGYRRYNATFAEAVVDSAPPGATVLLQDYHLALVAPRVRSARPDLRLVHFSHTPFAGPDWLGVLPDPYRAELLAGMAANHACCFHTARWQAGFLASCAAFGGGGSSGAGAGLEAPPCRVTPLGPDPADLRVTADGPACREAEAQLDIRLGDRRLVVRVDRIELSKNLLRGFWAYDQLLADRPDWRERVTFAVYVYPSREGLADYLAYRQETLNLVESINHRWATPSWEPILLDSHDDFPRSVAALRRYDVLLVNPIRDGMNLVAKEGPLVNRRDGVVVLSNEAGAWDELASEVVGVHPYDVSGTAEALGRALDMAPEERRRRQANLVELISANGPEQWLAGQLEAAAAS